jgi:hypothetical protein
LKNTVLYEHRREEEGGTSFSHSKVFKNFGLKIAIKPEKEGP